MDVLAKLGINPAVMIAQAVNFFALLAILTYFVYRPIMRALDERRERVAKADEHAKTIEKRLKDVETGVAAELAKAQTEARTIVENAKKAAKKVEEEMVADAKAKVEKVVAEGRADLIRERDEASAAIQSQVGAIVTLAAEKLLGREVTAKDQDRFVRDAMTEIENLK